MATDPKLLNSMACFQDLSDDQVNAIAEISNSVCYMKGHVLFEEGSKGELLYLLIDGDVDIYFKSAESTENKVDTVSSKEVLGCAALVPPHTYAATEKCLSDVEVLEINLTDLQDLIQQDPQIGFILQQHIIKTLNDRILTLRHRTYA